MIEFLPAPPITGPPWCRITLFASTVLFEDPTWVFEEDDFLPTELVALKEGFLRRWVVPELTNPPAGFIELTPVKKVGLVADAPEDGDAIATIGVLYFRILLRFRLRSDFLRLQVRLNFRIIRLPAASASFVIPGWPPPAPWLELEGGKGGRRCMFRRSIKSS